MNAESKQGILVFQEDNWPPNNGPTINPKLVTALICPIRLERLEEFVDGRSANNEVQVDIVCFTAPTRSLLKN